MTTKYRLTQPELEPLAVRPESAARLLGVSRATIRNWLNRGYLKSVRVGPARQCATLIPLASINELLAR